MEDEIVCGWGIITDYDCCDVSTLASHTQNRGVVSEHGVFGTHWIILRYGYIPVDIILRDCIYGTAWTVAVPKSI